MEILVPLYLNIGGRMDMDETKRIETRVSQLINNSREEIRVIWMRM